MPLVLMCGFPSVGKTKRAYQLEETLLKYKRNLEIHIVNDGTISRDAVYSDRKCEIIARSSLKAAADRLLTNTNVVILDSLNYVKGEFYINLYENSKPLCIRIECDCRKKLKKNRPEKLEYWLLLKRERTFKMLRQCCFIVTSGMTWNKQTNILILQFKTHTYHTQRRKF